MSETQSNWRSIQTLKEYADQLARTDDCDVYGLTEVTQDIVHLVENGLTPGEILDYWAMEISGFDKPDWMKIR